MENNPNFQDIFSTLMGGLVGLQPGDLNNMQNESAFCTYINWKRPHIDIVETENDISVYMFVPAVDKNSIDVNIRGNKLNIYGTRICPFTKHDTNLIYHKSDNIYGDFNKNIILPTSVIKEQKVRASCKDGLLIVIIDKETSGEFNVKIDVD